MRCGSAIPNINDDHLAASWDARWIPLNDGVNAKIGQRVIEQVRHLLLYPITNSIAADEWRKAVRRAVILHSNNQ